MLRYEAMSGSAERLVEALEAVSASPEGVSVTEAARTLGLSKAAASRLLASLSSTGLLERDSAQRYVLGLRLWEFGAQAARRLRIADIARTLVLQASNDTQTRVHISVLRGDKAYFLEMTDFAQGAAIPVMPAMPTVPAYCCAPGKVMLSQQRDSDIQTMYPSPLHAYTARTHTNPAELIDELHRIREQGYGVNTGEYMQGHIGIAVPIHDYTGRVVAAIGCSGFANDFENGDPLTQLPAMRDVAQSISAIMGYKAGARTTVG
jgi:IclR family transcriptional regulator, KDG regulon repressor